MYEFYTLWKNIELNSFCRVDRLKRELSSPPNSCSDTTQHSSGGGGGGGLNVIYDSRRGIPSSVGASGSHTASLGGAGEDGRAPSPEHVGIPAHPVQVHRPWLQKSHLSKSQGQLYYSGQKWRFWGWASWVHFFTRLLWPNHWHNIRKSSAKCKIWILSFHRYPMNLCRSSSLDTITQRSWAIFWKIQQGWKMQHFHKGENLFMACCFQNAIIQRQMKIFPWNKLPMATNFLNFQWQEVWNQNI